MRIAVFWCGRVRAEHNYITMTTNKEKKILAGITQDNELYFLNIDLENRNDDFSMTGETVRPIKEEDAKEQVREGLEDGEHWRYAVQSKQTDLGKDEWIESVLATDGELAGFDNSLFTYEVELDEETYLFESGSCGQHEEHDLKHYFIPESQFKAIMKMWKECHLKPIAQLNASTAKAVLSNALEIEQDIPALALSAVKIINENN